jgi:ParB family chromosome partitioning protein
MRNGAGTWDALLTVTQAKLDQSAGPASKKLQVDQIIANPDQPRQYFDPRAHAELAASIQAHGILQPLLVRPHPTEKGKYQIVAGERRYRAAKESGLKEVPTIVRELTDGEAMEFALVENVMREDISPLEEARSLKSLLDSFGYSYSQLGERLGRNKAYVDHRVRLLKMPAEIQQALEVLRDSDAQDGRPARPFTPRHAGVVAQLDSASLRENLIAAVLKDGLSVAETTRRKNLLKQVAETVPASEQRAKLEDAVVDGLAERDLNFRLSAFKPDTKNDASTPVASGLTEDQGAPRLDVSELAIYRLIAEAQANDGQEWASKLLWALNADRRKLRALLQDAEQQANPDALQAGA